MLIGQSAWQLQKTKKALQHYHQIYFLFFWLTLFCYPSSSHGFQSCFSETTVDFADTNTQTRQIQPMQQCGCCKSDEKFTKKTFCCSSVVCERRTMLNPSVKWKIWENCEKFQGCFTEQILQKSYQTTYQLVVCISSLVMQQRKTSIWS